MRPIDGDALEKYLSDAEIEAIKQRRYVFASAINTICGNVRNFPTIESEPQWIPCSERLPEGEYVLISKKPTKISGDEWCVTIAIRMADQRSRKVNWRDIGFGVIQDNEVLAWMPLPDPYKERREE